MKIIIRDEKTGNEYSLVGHKYDWEIFKRSKGKMVNGIMKGKNEWTSCHNYPNDIEYGVAKIIKWLIADEDDDEVITTDIVKFASDINKMLKKRVQQIVAEVYDD